MINGQLFVVKNSILRYYVIDYFTLRGKCVKKYASVRRPALANSTINKSSSNAVTSVGDVLRKAKKDLFFNRCIFGIIIVLLITCIICAFLLGYVGDLTDSIIEMMG